MRIASPAQSLTVNVFAPAPVERLTVSMLASESVPSPTRLAAASVKLTSADSATVSVPSPPMNVSLPARPVSVSSPPSPERVLARVLPSSTSAKADPVTFSILVSLDSVTVNAVTTVCVVVTARSTVTPPLARLVKSSVSVSASAVSTIVTLAERVPAKA